MRRLSSSGDFDRYATHWGGVLELDDDPDVGTADFDCDLICGLLTGLTQLDFVNAQGKALSLHAGIINDMEPNAFADKAAAEHFIGIHIGHFLSAWYVSGQLVRRRDTFPLIGAQPAGHFEGDIRLDVGFQEWARFADAIRGEDQDRIRGQAAVFLRHVIVWFGALHEWGHVTGGHCDLCESRHGLSRLQEVGKSEVAGGASATHYVLEYLADAAAMKTLTRQVGAGRDPLTATGLFELGRTDKQRLLLVGCGLMCALWHSINGSTFGDNGTHPRPTTRFLHLIQIYRREMVQMGLSEQSALRFVEIAVADLAYAGVHCRQLYAAMGEAIGILRSGRPWDEHFLVKTADVSLGDDLDAFAFHAR
jgi:hypothetical protein